MSNVRAGLIPIVVGVLSVARGADASAQSPFLFASIPNIGARIVTAIDAGYSARAFEPVAGERVEPRAAAAVALSSLFALQGQISAASTVDHQTRVSDQMELMVTPRRSGALSFGAALGVRHEYTGTSVALARAVGSRTSDYSALIADVLIEHPFASGRDAVDVITTVGGTHALTQHVWLGVEVVGSDLEGLFDSTEAEGGATVLAGPTLAVAVSTHWRLVLGGGPVLRATTSRAPSSMADAASLGGPSRPGYVLRTSLRHVW